MAPRTKKRNPNRIATRRNRNDVLLDTFLTLTQEIPKGCPSAQRPYYDGESFGLHEFCQLSGDETRKAWMVFDRGDEDSKIEFSVDYDVGTPTETTTFHRTARTPATAFQYAGYMAYWLEHGKFPKAPARSTRAPAKAKRLSHRNPATSAQAVRTGHVWRLTFDYGGSEDWPGTTAERAAAAAAAHWQRTCGYVPEVVGASNVTRNPSPAGHVRVSLASPNGAVYWHGDARQLLRDNAGDPDSARSLAHAIAKLRPDESVVIGGGAVPATVLTRLQDSPYRNPSPSTEAAYKAATAAYWAAVDAKVAARRHYEAESWQPQRSHDYQMAMRAEADAQEAMQVAGQAHFAEPSRNPSGAKQRARGTRARNRPHEGSQSAGSEWARQMNVAERLRKETVKHAPSSGKLWHSQTLETAARVRPALPNPSEQDSFMVAFRIGKAGRLNMREVVATSAGEASSLLVEFLRDEQGVTPTIVYSEPVWRWRMRQNPSSGAKQRARGSRDFHQGYGSRPDAAIGARYLQSAADLRASMAKTPAKRPGLLPWHKFDVESARFHRPKLPNPYSEGDFIADCAATGRQDAQNIYEDGNAYETIPKLTAYMLERLNEEGDHPSFSQETLQAGARAWAETWLATSKAIAAKYAREYEMEENPSSKRRTTSRPKPPAPGWQKWSAGVYGLVRGGVIVAYVRAQGRVWKWEIPSRFGAIHWAKSLAAGKKAVVAALRQPTANPSSGAKQRARGTRQENEHLSGYDSVGASHARGMEWASESRRERNAEHHAENLEWARENRPTLPNPVAPGVAHRLRGIEYALADATNSGFGVLLVYHETPPPAGMYSQVRAMKGGPNRTRFCAPHHTITPGPALDAALNDARGGILFLDHVDDFIPAAQREIAAHAHECLIVATAPHTEHVVRQLQDVLAYRSI